MKALSELAPDPDALLALEPEELGGLLLEYINRLPDNERRSQLHPSTILEYGLEGYPHHYRGRLEHALMEAWAWLQQAGMIAPSPGNHDGWVFITRSGQRVKGTADLATLRHAGLLSEALMHPVIVTKCTSAFLRGEYDTAVFQAYKEVEVAVRKAARLSDSDIGTDLMRKAFEPKTGPLSDVNTLPAEQQATAHLFAGAVGLYKNPHSHRNVLLSDPTEAAALIIYASHLLNLVEARAPKD